ncbi:CPBP family intramembrane metalloprotease [candidate division KSB1 bacterium]|nr:CPBP family intramembrane metalloprotease [candidate division KSB1 bacterium]
MDEFDDNPWLRPRELGFIFLMTLALFLATVLFVDFSDQRVALLLGEAVMIVPALVYVICRRLPILGVFRLQSLSFAQMAATIFLFFPVYILTDELDRIIQLLFPTSALWFESLVELVQFQSVPDALLLLLAAVFFAALFEEMLFRGLLQQTLEHFKSPVIAIVLAALFFTLGHFSLWTAVQITLLGLVLGYVAWKSGSILSSIVMHALNNLVSLIMMNVPQDSLSWYAPSGHVKLIWLAFAVALFVPACTFFNKACAEKNRHL